MFGAEQVRHDGQPQVVLGRLNGGEGMVERERRRRGVQRRRVGIQPAVP